MELSKSDTTLLVESSYIFLRIDETVVANAVKAFEKLISVLSKEAMSFETIRQGESSPDLGLISREVGQGKDVKHFFHWSHDLFMKLDIQQRNLLRTMKLEIQAIDTCYRYVNNVALTIGAGLQNHYGDVFGTNLVKNMLCGVRSSTPYSTNTLRSLLYPPVMEQKGAHPHDDRGFFAIHLFSQNGELIGFKPTGEAFLLRPPIGHAVVFFGAKAEIMSGGRVSSLRHGSKVVLGLERRAMVQFIHADVGMKVDNAEVALSEFRAT